MRIPTALVFAALLAPGAARAGADDFAWRCEHEMRPVLEVTTHPPGFAVDNTVSSRVLNTRNTHETLSALALGLTASTIHTEVTFDAPGLVEPGGTRECVSPRIWVELSYDPLRVYVAREFNSYSCSYRAVYEHEMGHVRLYRDSLPRLEQALRAALAARYGERPLYAPAGRGLDQVASDVDRWLRPLIRDELDKIDQLHVAFDSPEESFRLSHACQGEIAAQVNASH